MKKEKLIVGFFFLIMILGIVLGGRIFWNKIWENPSEKEVISSDNSKINNNPAKFNLKLDKNNGENVLQVFLQNPQKRKISSARVFLAFPPEKLNISNLKINDNPYFSMIAPGENRVDRENGIIKIGLSTEKNNFFSDSEILLAEVFYQKSATGKFAVDFIPEKTGIFEFLNSELVDISVNPEIPAIFL